MRRLITTILLATLFLGSLPVSAFNQGGAVSYLKSRANDDWVVMALASSGALNGVDLGFLNGNPGSRATDIEKRMLARSAAGLDDAGLANRLVEQFNGVEIGAGDGLLNDDIFGLLALVAAEKKSEVRGPLANFIKKNQNSDGGWGFAQAPTSSDSNDTAMAIMALLAQGESNSSSVIQRGYNFLNTTRSGDGYAFNSNFAADTASTAWVVSVLRAGNRGAPAHAISYLEGQQKPDGSFVWQGAGSGTALMTAYATIALNNDYYPVKKASPPPPPAGKPDLVITDLNPASDKIQEGDDVAFDIRVKNSGAAKTNAKFNTQFWVDERNLDTKRKGPLASGEADWFVSDGWDNISGGSHQVKACTDVKGEISESNEKNNCTTTRFEVQSGFSDVGGRVVDQNGDPVQGVSIKTCGQGKVTTDGSGNWRVTNLLHRTGLCARVTSLPTGYFGAISTNNTSETKPNTTYEWQVSGVFCRQDGGCNSKENNWDIKNDLKLNFKVSKKEIVPPPPPADPTFEVAIISPVKNEFVGQLSFSNFTLTDSSGQNHNFTSPAAIGTVSNSGLPHNIDNTSFGLFVESIVGVQPQGTNGWMYAVNGVKPAIGASDYILKDGDQVIWFYGHFTAQPPPFPGEPPPPGPEQANVSLSVDVVSNPPPPPPSPSIELHASKSDIKLGDSVTLTWRSENATRVVSSTPGDWAEGKLSGSVTIQPMITTTYSIVVSGSPEMSNAVTITVDQAPSVVFGVSKGQLYFGKLAAGQISPQQTLTLINSGAADLEITANLENSVLLYHNGLMINDLAYDKFNQTVVSGSTQELSIKLKVPGSFSETGRKTDTLIFWATPK